MDETYLVASCMSPNWWMWPILIGDLLLAKTEYASNQEECALDVDVERQRNWFWLGNAKRLRHMLGRQHRPSATRPHRVSVAPDFEIPIGYRTVGVEGCLQFRHHRRPERLPGVFLLARPLHSNRRAGQSARDQGRIGRDIVRAVVAIAPGAFDVDAADV